MIHDPTFIQAYMSKVLIYLGKLLHIYFYDL